MKFMVMPNRPREMKAEKENNTAYCGKRRQAGINRLCEEKNIHDA